MDQWQQSEPYVAWARNDPMFGMVLAVVQNGMLAVPPDQFSGYRAALNLLLSLRIAPRIPPRAPAPTYREPLSEMNIDREQPED